MTENKRYDVIYEKEPRGQVVTDNGIPCTARTCCTRLNWLEEENKKLKQEIKGFEGCSHNFGLLYDEVKNKVEELSKENRKLKSELNLSKLNLKEKNEGFDKIHKMYMEQIEENKELKQLIKKVIDERVVDYPLLCKIKEMVKE